MVAGALYLLLFVGCFLFLVVVGVIAWVLFAVGKRQEAGAASARAQQAKDRGEAAVDAEAALSRKLDPDDPSGGGEQ